MKVNKYRNAALSAFFIACPLVSYADGWPSWQPETAAVPFVFSTESMGLTVGGAGVIKGVGQPQAAVLGAGVVSDKGSWIGYLGASNFQLGRRFLFGLEGYDSEFVGFEYYLGDAAKNDGVQSEAIIASSRESLYRFSARYVLPLGAGTYQGAKAAYWPTRTITGSNPVDSGVTSIEVQPFYQSRNLEENQPAGEATKSVGAKLTLDWDNRDHPRNPTSGSQSQFTLTRGLAEQEQDAWWTWEAEQSAFFDLGNLGNVFDKQVIAVNVYTGDTPSWEDDPYYQPPAFAGLKLGGLYRLRSFQSGRFHDRSALSYTAEYRVMPDWQPLGELPVFNLYDVPWWQWVAFMDVGRVASEYNLRELHQNMKWSAGVAMRFQVEGVVVRSEMAWGSEDSLFRVMINQPF